MQKLLINHCLDGMHCEKNFCHNIVQTILGAKDNESVRRDMEDLQVREHLWVQERVPNEVSTDIPESGKGKEAAWMPPAPYCLSRGELSKFLRVLVELRVPSGFSSSLSKCITKSKKLAGLKSHDYHQLMHQILPLATIGLLDRGEACYSTG